MKTCPKLEELPIEAIKPYDKNPRINDGAVDKVAKSIEKFGFQSPIILDENNVIICGHTRYKAAQSLGLDEVPCIVAEGLTPNQVREYRIADNRTGEFALWDYDKLISELDALDLDIGKDLGLDSLTHTIEIRDSRGKRWVSCMLLAEFPEDVEKIALLDEICDKLQQSGIKYTKFKRRQKKDEKKDS